MNNVYKPRALHPLIVLAGLSASVSPVWADVADECRQEAVDYDIPEDMAESYVGDCIASRGGSVEAVDEEYADPGLDPNVEPQDGE